MRYVDDIRREFPVKREKADWMTILSVVLVVVAVTALVIVSLPAEAKQTGCMTNKECCAELMKYTNGTQPEIIKPCFKYW